MQTSTIRALVATGLATGLVLSALYCRQSISAIGALHPGPEGDGVRLFNGWKITPAGRHVTTSDMLLGCAMSPDTKTLAMTAVGYGAHELYLVNTATGQIRQKFPLGRGWNGVVWSPNGDTLYASGGASPAIHVFRQRADRTFAADKDLLLANLAEDAKKEKGKAQAYVSGLALSPDGATLYIANLASDSVFALDVAGSTVKAQRKLTAGARPYCVRLAPDRSVLYVTQWAEGNIVALDPQTLEPVRTITTNSHPNDFIFTREGLMIVSCGNDDAVDIIDPRSGQVKERISTSLTPRAPAGATPNAVALSEDGRTLYVANADNNAVAVVDISILGRSHISGFIPTGWYPTAVCVAPDGKHLLIGSGKGMGTHPNPARVPQTDKVVPTGFQYIGRMLNGMISLVDLPTPVQLAAYTKQVYANTPYTDALMERAAMAPAPGTSPIPSRVGDPSPIKYILYIIKENRTYDQVFGDMKDGAGRRIGNGDPNLTLFGEDVTPNQHELARQYVLLDNVYCNGEVSADGHPWSTAAYVTDIGQRVWTVGYGGKGPQPLNEKVAVPRAGYIWDACARNNLPYRSYGEQVFAAGPDAPPGPLSSIDGVTGLRGHASKTWQTHRGRDWERADVFINELKEFERTDSLPRFMVMSLGENHTEGTKPGAFTPKAKVASNDLGVGKIVEACSQSKFWKEMAIFIIEDDAQNGPDHVDAHRTPALVVSPYVRRHTVDSTFYTTTSLLRTMELMLGLPPLTEYDAASTPLYNTFTMQADYTPYKALPARIDLNAKNGQLAYGAQRSLALNFSTYDDLSVADEDALNRVLWHSIKGAGTPYPGTTRRPLFASTGGSLARPHVSGADDEKRPAPARRGAPRARDDD